MKSVSVITVICSLIFAQIDIRICLSEKLVKQLSVQMFNRLLNIIHQEPCDCTINFEICLENNSTCNESEYSPCFIAFLFFSISYQKGMVGTFTKSLSSRQC